jgi:hypothetical protein
MSSAGLAALLNNVPTPWAVGFALLIAGVTYDLTSMCGVDPPALPVLTAADMTAVAFPFVDVGAYVTAVAKFYTFIKYWAWFQFCECSTIATPAPAAAPGAPANLPQLYPSVGTPSFGLPCWEKLAVRQTGGTTILEKNISAALLPPGATRASSNGGIAGLEIAMPSPRPTHITYTVTVNGEDVTSNIDITVQFSNAAGVQTGQSGATFAVNTTGTIEFDVPANSTFWEVGIDDSSGLHTLTCSIDFKAFCGGNTGTTVTAPCCPPDPILSGQLQQLLVLVTLLQRQLVPFAYISSTAHAGLTGAGSIVVQGLLGVRIDLTTVPGSVTQDASTPPFLFNVGWVSAMDANGFIEETRAHAAHQVWFPRVAADATLIGYSFTPGVIATITELQREP